MTLHRGDMMIRSINREAIEALDGHARRHGMSRSGLVRLIIGQWLKRPQVSIGPDEGQGVSDANHNRSARPRSG